MENMVRGRSSEDIARLSLDSKLRDILKSENVYFQPPASVRLQYPAIVYHLEDIPIKYADNRPYTTNRRYVVHLIDKNPDSPFINKMYSLPGVRFERSYPSDNLNHFVYTVYT